VYVQFFSIIVECRETLLSSITTLARCWRGRRPMDALQGPFPWISVSLSFSLSFYDNQLRATRAVARANWRYSSFKFHLPFWRLGFDARYRFQTERELTNRI